MTRQKLIIAGLIFVVLLIVANAALTAINFTAVNDTTARQAGEQQALRATQTALAGVQRTLIVSQKASTKTRVTTVSQRCALTTQVWQMSLKVDPVVSQNLYLSLLGCEGQLNVVKAINARTPAPKGR